MIAYTTGCGYPFRKRNGKEPCNTALRQFLEFADLDARKLYVNVIVYADESGTHDPAGKQPGSSITIVAGYAAFGDSWEAFARKWQAVLDKYHGTARERYFHFSELPPKSGQMTLRGCTTVGVKGNGTIASWTWQPCPGISTAFSLLGL
jgi:hypothetical protein